MRILYFAPVFPPEQSGGSTHIYELAREWVRLGHSVTVTKGFPCHPHGRIPEKYRGRWLALEALDGIDIVYTRTYATPNVGRARRALGYLTGALAPLAANLGLGRRYDVIIGTCPHIFLVLAAFVMGAITRTPYVYEIRDLWPKQIVDLGQIRNGLLIGLLEAVHRFLCRRARAVVTVTRAVRESVVRSGIDPRKVFVVPNGVDCGFFRPAGPGVRERVRRELGLEGNFVAAYFGTFGLSQGLSTVLEAAELLREERDVVFVLAGDGAERARLLAEKERRGLGNVLFLPPQPRERMPELYAASDAGLVPLRRVPLFRQTVPSKMYELLACGVPVVLGVDGEARSILERSGGGVFVEPEDPRALAEALRRLRASSETRAAMARAGAAFARSECDRALLAARFARLLAAAARARV